MAASVIDFDGDKARRPHSHGESENRPRRESLYLSLSKKDRQHLTGYLSRSNAMLAEPSWNIFVVLWQRAAAHTQPQRQPTKLQKTNVEANGTQSSIDHTCTLAVYDY